MKIVTPISSVTELDMLMENGADELYCGVITPEWETLFGKGLWMNRRSPDKANIFSWEDLHEITETAHAGSVSVSITLNAPFYPDDGMKYLLKLCEKLVREIGVDTLIISDLNLLMQLSRQKMPVRIHLSSLGSCFNAGAVDFYQRLGVRRIILPRQLMLSEINAIVRKSDSSMEFEVFALNDGCFFEEGVCQTTHTLGPFCLTNWKYQQCNGRKPSDFPRNFHDEIRELHEYLWCQNNCGSSFQKDGLPNGPCSLCWFGLFRDWGIKAVKIVGREASFQRKMASLQLVKAMMDKVLSTTDTKEIKNYAKQLRGTPEYCEKKYLCYFREK